MSVAKVVKIIGESEESFAKAADAAITEACKSVRNVKSFQVDQLSGEVREGRITKYRASVEIAFVVD